MDETASRGSLIGRRVSNYEIVANLGAGGMGVVYKARDLKLDRPAALKFLPPQACGEQEKSRLLREARAASTLDHVNIGTIYGIEEDGGQLFIAMAYYEGETLAQRVRRGPLAPAPAVRFAIQIAEGLAYAHAKGIVHRDIKPSNILITREGVLKIVDFGLAQIASAETLTETGTAVGTAAYMSPEQATGQEVDGRTDVWSLGVLLYEMVTGTPPFRAPSIPAILYKIVHEAPLPMAGVPPELERVILRCVAKDVAERYGSMQELARDLRAMEAPPSGATQTLVRQEAPAPVRTSRPGRPRGLRSKAFAILAAALVLIAALLLWPARREIARWFGPGQVKRHIAVLPFRNVGNDPNNEAVCDGLMETVTSRLADFQSTEESIWVVPARDVRLRKVTDGGGARREFGATLVVTGSVQRAGGGVRLTVELQETARPRIVDSAVLDEASANLVALQDAAVAKLAAMMDLRLRAPSGTSTGTAGAAYESYLKGLGYMRRFDVAGNLDLAIQAFQEALHADARFALADAGLAEAYQKQYELTRDAPLLAKATDYCNRATELDAQLTPAYITLGQVHVSAGQVPLAVEEFRHALDLAPRSADAMQGLARAYEAMGRVADAEKLLTDAAALQPDYWAGYNRLGSFYVGQRRYDEAARQFRRVLELTPDNAAGLSNLAAVLIETGAVGEAGPLLEKAIRLAPSYALYSNLGLVYLEREKYPEAIAAFQKALKLNEKDYRLWSNLALAYFYSGDETGGRQALLRAAALAEAAAKLQPQDAVLQANLAKYAAWLGRREEALIRLQSALVQAPEDAQVLKRAAETYERLGMRREAVGAIRHALERGYTRQQLERNHELKHLAAEADLKK
jgi:serine/threonine-protein kinase